MDVVGVGLRAESGAQPGLAAARLAKLHGELDKRVELPNLSGDFRLAIGAALRLHISFGGRGISGEFGLVETAACPLDRLDQRFLVREV